MVKILIKKLNSRVKLPKYKTDGSSGMDLMALLDKPISIMPQKSELIPTGLSIAIPDNTEIQIRPRSGLAAKNNISVLNTPGTIDSDYRGELKIILYNHGSKEFVVKNEDRIGISLAHISNANIGNKNPGVEIISLSYQKPF